MTGGGTWVRHSVFEGLEGKGKAAVVVNFGNDAVETAVNWQGGGAVEEVLQPFREDRTESLPVRLKLPPRTLAVGGGAVIRSSVPNPYGTPV